METLWPPNEWKGASSILDSFGRRFTYLRLSLTSQCNFRCSYCLPQGCVTPLKSTLDIQLPEIRNLAKAFSELGFKKIRLTGGEPTLRPDLVEVVRALAEIPGIESVALTTNGFLFAPLAAPLKRAGLSAVNFSLDSLEEAQFVQITGTQKLWNVLEAVKAAKASGISQIKANVVLLRHHNFHSLDSFIDWSESQEIPVRFIELMKTSDNADLFEKEFVSARELEAKLSEQGWFRNGSRSLNQVRSDSGPSQTWLHPMSKAQLGIIAPYSENFCQSCNRLRMSSQAQLRLCLYGERDYSLRHLLQTEDQKEELKSLIRHLLIEKPKSHRLQQGFVGRTSHLASIGG